MAETDLKRVDFEPYFLAWNSVLFYPDPSKPENEILLYGHSGDPGSIPCYQHKTCGGMVKVTADWKPMRVCPHCSVDTATEVDPEATPDQGKRQENGSNLWLP